MSLSITTYRRSSYSEELYVSVAGWAKVRYLLITRNGGHRCGTVV